MWFRVDDSFYDHPKAVGISNDSLATWVRAGDWCSRQLTDGAVPAGMLATCAGDAADPEAAARDLVDRNLWEDADRGWQFHDWADWNPTRAQVLAKRKKDADRRRDWLAKRSGVSHDVSHGVSSSVTHSVSNGVSALASDDADDPGEDHGVSHGVHHAAPDPTRPDPARPVGEGRSGTGMQSSSGRDAGAQAREASPDDDDQDEELSQVQALMAAAGRPVGREDASKILAAVLAKAGARVRNRRAFIGRVLGDQKQARAYAPGAAPHTPTAREIIDQSRRPGGPSEHVADHAEEARQRLAAREPVERGDDPARGLWGEELARAQLAEARAARGVIDPEPAADPETPGESGGEPEAEDESAADDEPEEGGDDEFPF